MYDQEKKPVHFKSHVDKYYRYLSIDFGISYFYNKVFEKYKLGPKLQPQKKNKNQLNQIKP